MKSWIVGSSVVLAVAVGFQGSNVKPIVNPAVKPVGLTAHDTHAAASLLGQFRTTFSSWMFLRADMYLHNGVEMRPLSGQEVKSGRKGVGGSHDEKEKLHDDSKIVTVVPSAEMDFRGIFGDVERAVTSYKDMTGHSHNNPTSTLPLFRLMTMLDPQFVQGWTTGGFILLWDRKKDCVEKSLAFLDDGLKNNPQSIDILTQIAYVYLRDMSEIGYAGRNYKQAIPFLERARKVGVENFNVLSEPEKEALLENYRRLAVSYREIGEYRSMGLCAQEGLEYFKNDGPLQKHMLDAVKILKGEPVNLGKVEINAPDGSDL